MALPEREESIWHRISDQAAAAGVPKAACSTITPFSFWVVIASIVIFIPLALIVAFFVRRQAIVVQGGAVMIYQLSFWRFRVSGEPQRVEFGPDAVRREGGALIIAGSKYHLQPGWEEPADRIVALAGGTGEGPA